MAEMTGGCACGAVRFRATADPMGVGVCHCVDCQKSSGGGPNYVALIPKPGFEVTKGEPKVYTCQGDSGGDVSRAFCADCGSPLWSALGGEVPYVPVKLGAFDDSSGFAPNLHLYTASAPPWHLMHHGLPAFPKAPPFAPPGS